MTKDRSYSTEVGPLLIRYNDTTILFSHVLLRVSRVDGEPFSFIGFDFAGWPTNREGTFSVMASSGAVANYVPDGLVDAVEIAIIPVLLGGGVPLLPSPASTAGLKLKNHRVYEKTGTVLLKYAVS